MFFFFFFFRYVVRQLWKDRAIAIVVTVTIALGIGVNTAVFSILNGFQRPLPVTAPEQIVVLAADTKGDETGFRFTFSYAALEDIRRRADGCAGLHLLAEPIRRRSQRHRKDGASRRTSCYRYRRRAEGFSRNPC